MATKKLILLVEDSENWQNSLTELLEEAQYNVNLAQDPDEAIRKLEKKSAALVIVDIVLQGTDIGLALIGSIRNKYPELPIIAISAERKIMTLSRVYELYGTHRIAAFVDKVSFDGEQFLALIKKVLLESKRKTPQSIFIAHDYQGDHKILGDKLSNLMRSLGYTIYRPTDDSRGGNLWLEIRNEIDASDLGFFDISSFNPNVCFELGYALGKRKPYYLLLNEKLRHMDIPDTLSGELRVQYFSEIELLDEIVKILKPTEFLDKKFAYDYVNSHRLRARPNSAIIIVPNDIFQQTVIEKELFKTLKQRRYRPRSLAVEGTNDLTKIYQEISEVGLIVCSVVGKTDEITKYQNAKAMVLLGIAMGIGKRTIILQQGKDGPSDLKSLVREYEGGTEAANRLDKALDEVRVPTSKKQNK